MNDKMSGEEKDLFRQSQKQTRPLKATDKIIPQKTKVKVKRLVQSTLDDSTETFIPDPVAKVSGEETLSFQRSGVQPRTIRQLRQGKLPPEATLDLHGFTIQMATEELPQYITKCINKGKRVIRIIHGKGHTSKQQSPPLKNAVNRCLQNHLSVLAFCSAPISDGGSGAVYVLLKRPSY